MKYMKPYIYILVMVLIPLFITGCSSDPIEIDKNENGNEIINGGTDDIPSEITFLVNDAMDVCEGRATIKGFVSNTVHVSEMGIMFGANPIPSENNAIINPIEEGDDFEVTITGLYEATTYYYRAYVYMKGKYYKGEIKSFTTKPYNYTRSGKIWGTVLVNGTGMKSFRIMQTELTNYLVNANQDVAVTKAEFKDFLNRLREETGLNFRLPTSEEWKFAAMGGSKSRRYTYAGSNNIDDVAWYSANAASQIHAVGTKKPNELGLYDMCGNYAELCNDSPDKYNVDGAAYGGSYKSTAANCTPTSFVTGSTSGLVTGSSVIRELNAYDATYISFRLVYDVDNPRLGDGTGGAPNMNGVPENNGSQETGSIEVQSLDATGIDFAKATISGLVSGLNYNVDVGILYHTERDKVLKEGSEMTTRSDGNFSVNLSGLFDETTYYYCAFAVDNNIRYTGEIKKFTTKKYTYEVDGKTFGLVKVETDGSIKPFCIMQTEVPPSRMDRNGDGAITTAEMKAFVDQLRLSTGLKFRQPSCEEWMFAAAGGLKSHNYKYAGSDNADDVAWYVGNSYNCIHAFASKESNELGLYDMSGNYGEICSENITLHISADAGPIYGGCFKDAMEDCSITSNKASVLSGYVPNTKIKEKDATDASCNTIRLVYSR